MAGVIILKNRWHYDRDSNDKYMQRPGHETKTWDASSLTSYIIQDLRTTCHLLDYNNRSNPREDIYAQTACRREGNRLLLVIIFGGRNPDRFFPMAIRMCEVLNDRKKLKNEKTSFFIPAPPLRVVVS